MNLGMNKYWAVKTPEGDYVGEINNTYDDAVLEMRDSFFAKSPNSGKFLSGWDASIYFEQGYVVEEVKIIGIETYNKLTEGWDG